MRLAWLWGGACLVRRVLQPIDARCVGGGHTFVRRVVAVGVAGGGHGRIPGMYLLAVGVVVAEPNGTNCLEVCAAASDAAILFSKFQGSFSFVQCRAVWLVRSRRPPPEVPRIVALTHLRTHRNGPRRCALQAALVGYAAVE